MNRWRNHDAPFIVFEGIDGSGKSSQVERVTQRLQTKDYACVATREPTDGPAGSIARQVVEDRIQDVCEDSLALMMASDRLDHVDNVIEPALDESKAVLCDRYVPSSCVYHATYENGDLAYDWIQSINERAMDPDMIVYLDCDVRTCWGRIAHKSDRSDNRYEDRDALVEYKRRYETVLDDRESVCPVERFDSSRAIDDISEDIEDTIIQEFGRSA